LEDFCSSSVFYQETGLLLISSACPQRHLLAVKAAGGSDVSKKNQGQ
jgi:hypothetical protein